MALQPAENSLPALHPYFHEAPEQRLSSLRTKALAFKTLAVITNLAVGIITTALLAITLLTTAPLLGPLPLGLIAAAVICGLSSPKIHQAAKSYAAKARFGERIAQELELIKNWKTPEIKTFFAHHELSLEHLPIESLAQINPNEPLCALLPLIARFNYLDKHFRKEHAKYEKNLEIYRTDPKLKEVARDIVISKLEKACKSKLRAAYLLGVLAKPHATPAIEAIGSPISLQQRSFEQFYLSHTNYFEFHGKTLPINQHEMMVQSPDGLCRRLYPNSDIFVVQEGPPFIAMLCEAGKPSNWS